MTEPNNLISAKCALLEAAASDSRLTDLDIRVAVVLLKHLNRQPGPTFGKMWPSASRVAENACTSKRSVHRALANLSRYGYFRAIEQGGGRRSDGTSRTNIYEIGTVPEMATLPEVAPLTLPADAANVARNGASTLPPVAHKPVLVNLENNLIGERADAQPASYQWEGKVIRLSHRHYREWRQRYHAIPDIDIELQSLDDHYSDTLTPQEQKDWWHRAQNALKNKHQKFIGQQQGASLPNQIGDVLAETNALYRKMGVI